MKNKRIITWSLLPILLFLTSCARRGASSQKPPTDFFYGTIYRVFGIPTQNIIIWLGDRLGGANGFGFAILIITIAVNLILLPLRLNQTRKQTLQQEKMRLIQPQINLINQRVKQTKDQEEQLRLNKLMMEVYRRNDTSMIPQMGCLTLIIQLPIFSGLFLGIEYSKVLQQSTFLGVNLGKPNLIIVFLSAFTYLIQGYMSLTTMSPEQRRQSRSILVISPLMIFLFTFASPAGLGLYFLGTGVLNILQQAITNYLILPQIRQQIDEGLKQHPIVEVVTEATFNEATTTVSNPDNAADSTDNLSEAELRKRNAGKQHRS